MIWLLRALGGRPKKPLKSVTYDAILFKRFTTTSATRPHSALINYVWQNVFAKDDMFVDSEAMRVGNREGLGLMEQMAKISSDLRAQKKINKEQKLTNEEQKLVNDQQKLTNEEQKLRWCMVVYTEIEQKAHPQTEEAILARRERNQIIHGGNIIDHLEYIGFGKNKIPPGRHDSVRKAFEIWYEVPFRYKERIDHAPELVVRTFNLLADTKSLRIWSNAPIVHEVQKICRGIISRWLEWVDAGEGEYSDAYIRREFEKLETLKSG